VKRPVLPLDPIPFAFIVHRPSEAIVRRPLSLSCAMRLAPVGYASLSAPLDRLTIAHKKM